MKKSTVVIVLIAAGLILCVGFVLCLGAAYFISGKFGQSNEQAIIGRWECRNPQAQNSMYWMYEFFRDGTMTWHDASATSLAHATYTFADNGRMKIVENNPNTPSHPFIYVFKISISGDHMTITIEGQTGSMECNRVK